MVNMYLIKKYGAFFMIGFLSVLGFIIGEMYFSFMWGMAGFGIGTLLGVLVASAMLYNPFTAMLEGQGILMLDVNSTGIIRPFIMAVHSPFIHGKVDGALHEDVFDREMVFNFAVPQKAGMVQQGEGKDGQIRTALILDEAEYNKGRFGFLHYPCILFNSQLNTVITKDWFSDMEKTGYAEHQVLYLNKKVEQLTDAMLNFGRYIVDQLKPKGSILGNWLIWVLLIGVIVILIIMFAPSIMQAVGGAGFNLGTAASNAQSAITPK